MMIFAIGVALLVLLAGWILRPAWHPSLAPVSARPAHLGILGELLVALDREHAAGESDAQQHQTARSELQRRVLDESDGDDTAIGSVHSPRVRLLVTLAVPLFAIALYAAIGNPAGLSAQPTPITARSLSAPESEASPEAMQAMLARMAERLDKPSNDPAKDLQGWTTLASSYAALQRFADADRAYARAIALAPNDAQLLADRADVLAVLQGQHSAGEPDRLIAEALRLDPKNLKALALAGGAAFERKDFAVATAYWQKARAIAPDGGEFAAALDRSLIAARDASGDTATTKAAPAAASPARITGRVSLLPELAAKTAPTDTVLVFARAAEGSRMPLAIVRRTVADLPFDFTLDDSLAMSPQSRLSGASRVIVEARVSKSANAIPQTGDLFGETRAMGSSNSGVSLIVDGVRP